MSKYDNVVIFGVEQMMAQQRYNAKNSFLEYFTFLAVLVTINLHDLPSLSSRAQPLSEKKFQRVFLTDHGWGEWEEAKQLTKFK